jgi:hypothetical protein
MLFSANISVVGARRLTTMKLLPNIHHNHRNDHMRRCSGGVGGNIHSKSSSTISSISTSKLYGSMSVNNRHWNEPSSPTGSATNKTNIQRRTMAFQKPFVRYTSTSIYIYIYVYIYIYI